MHNILENLKNIASRWRIKNRDLLFSPRTDVIHIEFTTACNLACIFCAVNSPDYRRLNLEAPTLRNIIASLSDNRMNLICVNGHGETTTYLNWHLFCNQLLDKGFPLHITTNFCKIFSVEELETLARFKSIEISCDTHDRELFGKLRRGGDLDVLVGNIAKLRRILTHGKKINQRFIPSLSFSCVVSSANVLHLTEYIRFALPLGITHFNFCNLNQHPDLNVPNRVLHISEMPADQLEDVERSLLDFFDYLKRNRIDFSVQAGLLSELRRKIQENRIQVNSGVADGVETAPPESPVEHQKVTRTRDCLDPWKFLFIQANKEVSPCCWHPSAGSLGSAGQLPDIVNNIRLRELRWQLLTGHLHEYCITCPSRDWIDLERFKEKVFNYINPGTHFRKSLKIPAIKPDRLIPLPMSYETGWHPPESAPRNENSERRQWRWTSDKAVCRISNPGEKIRILFFGAVNKSCIDYQHIELKCNGNLLDRFSPASGDFYREYIITKEITRNEKTFLLVIETDKVFVPADSIAGSNDYRRLGIQVFKLEFIKC